MKFKTETAGNSSTFLHFQFRTLTKFQISWLTWLDQLVMPIWTDWHWPQVTFDLAILCSSHVTERRHRPAGVGQGRPRPTWSGRRPGRSSGASPRPSWSRALARSQKWRRQRPRPSCSGDWHQMIRVFWFDLSLVVPYRDLNETISFFSTGVLNEL